MLHNILVPLDGSPVGEAALPYAIALAGRCHARLTLIRAAGIPPLTIDKGTAQVRALAEADAYLKLHLADLRARDYQVEAGAPYGGKPAEWIVEEVDLRGADLIVMATHDRLGPTHWLHGSVTEAVVQRAPVPVLVVRAANGVRPVEHFDWRQPTLVVPLDGSDLAESVLPTALQLAQSMDGRLVLVSVVPRKESAIEVLPRLEVLLDEVTRCAVLVESAVRVGDPATEIALLARERNAAAIVMATHGRTGLTRTVMGSVAGQLVHRAPSPVLLYRPQTAQPAEAPVAISLALAGSE